MAKRVTGKSSSTSSSKGSKGNQIFAARVRAIILDETTYPEAFKRFGDWSSIGIIFWNSITSPNPNPDDTAQNYAQPLFPNQKHYPLTNEIVYIIALPDSNNATQPNSTTFYYFQPISIWGNTHHNAIPNPFESTLPSSQQQDYQETEAGAVRRVTDGGTEINLGQTFTEKLEIKTLLPYEGDIIHEGRWGQSWRYGSTVNNASIPNPWSSAGANGDPIIILKNGQHDDGTDPWVPQVEDINKDKSSVYLTSTQKIPIEAASTNYKGYTSAPTTPNQFTGEQIILTSGRLLFNSKNDSILFSSSKTINLNSLEDVVIESPKTIIQSKEIYFGDKSASEPVILGNKFLNDMSKLLTQIIALSTALMTPVGSGIPFIPNAAIPVPATQLQLQANQMLSSIETYKSKISKTR
jgi:hypothetical protein|tara:strand:+ start:79 stop:1305 length:1227 start_codon:yes stop_codon:yes gene_type:complete